MGLFSYTPNTRPRSDSELRDLRDGAAALRASARRNQHDPVKAARELKAAQQNEADIQAEHKRRR
ncbi:hypothetical protein SLUN_12965 [Streptomyces lunaelactis]|uniref:Uncharacterized protein n=1 Tax=Streptomyces lunaelactis TaxID=1535768 RepID=A0A2R4T1G0_9ACTN|nr:hypothetical protein [Streptomyces lunaelactis]AVZ72968.1 hypothetical protein SLUN_12965 [Streptomyces lunaelactis]